MQKMNGKGYCLYILIGYLSLCLVAAPSHAAPKASHKVERSAANSSDWPHKGLHPDTRTDDIASYRIYYARSHKNPAVIVVSMHLDTYEGIKNGSGSFQKQTPKGRVSVKWHREWVTLEKTEDGQPVDPENAWFPVYSVNVASPESLLVRLETQQYDLLAVRLNGHGVSVKPHLQGDVDTHGPYDATRFAYTFPGGHNAIVLRAYYFRNE